MRANFERLSPRHVFVGDWILFKGLLYPVASKSSLQRSKNFVFEAINEERRHQLLFFAAHDCVTIATVRRDEKGIFVQRHVEQEKVTWKGALQDSDAEV